jgi:NADPH:quinone reductase-like Zn-dependent oxidoreductase
LKGQHKKAIVHEQHGTPDILNLREVENPAPKEDEVMVKVHAASKNYIDWQVLRGGSFLLHLMNGLLKPIRKILGADVAGWVGMVGKTLKQFQPVTHLTQLST